MSSTQQPHRRTAHRASSSSPSSSSNNVNNMSDPMTNQSAPLIPASSRISPFHDINDSPPPSPRLRQPDRSSSRFSYSNPLKSPWIPIAAASGACAAINGVFAKLTTTALTTSWARHLSTFLHLSPSNHLIAFSLRAFFFVMNLAANALMWTLFTMALTRATSTTRVSLINTSFNFLLTALAGFVVFGEKLPPLWWVGAMGLVVGNVVIGRKGEGREGEGAADDDRGKPGEEGVGRVRLDEVGEGEEGARYRDEANEQDHLDGRK